MAWLLDVKCGQQTGAKDLCTNKAHHCGSTDMPVGNSTTHDNNAAVMPSNVVIPVKLTPIQDAFTDADRIQK